MYAPAPIVHAHLYCVVEPIGDYGSVTRYYYKYISIYVYMYIYIYAYTYTYVYEKQDRNETTVTTPASCE